ncbi:MAG: hypothetical protein IIB46_05745 [Nitrospinae bacterium]|nr:hypothetical protein [Nitrospinota bacterium]
MAFTRVSPDFRDLISRKDENFIEVHVDENEVFDYGAWAGVNHSANFVEELAKLAPFPEPIKNRVSTFMYIKLIEEKTIPENRILISDEDAIHFSCNAVLLDRNIIMNHASAKLEKQLENAGYTVYICPVNEFLKAGGANKCLTFELDPFKENEKQDIEKNKMPLAVGP